MFQDDSVNSEFLHSCNLKLNLLAIAIQDSEYIVDLESRPGALVRERLERIVRINEDKFCFVFLRIYLSLTT